MPLNVSSAFPDLGRDAPGGKAARAGKGKGKAAGKGGKAADKAGDKPAAPAKPAASAAQKALQKMGLVRDIDLALHLPLRYEDETRITALRNAREGDTVQ
ncbi:MAG: ATP-dependent DNA helicase RecG, partial [Delftia sp.]|nr:ATP-dependent DNA helicase RecG [Delftia sp.]